MRFGCGDWVSVRCVEGPGQERPKPAARGDIRRDTQNRQTPPIILQIKTNKENTITHIHKCYGWEFVTTAEILARDI